MNVIATRLARTRTWRARAIGLIGPATSVGGFAWAFLQPERITLLHPAGQGFWWLLVEPPLWVVLVGVLFARLVAGPLLEDLDAAES
jgi:hypothetical protein